VGVRIGCPGTVEKTWMDSTFRTHDTTSSRKERSSSKEGEMNVLNQIGCKPKEPDAKCLNCKRRVFSTLQVRTKNSKDKACIYIPISLQEKT